MPISHRHFRDKLQTQTEWVNQSLDADIDLAGLRSVAVKGEKLYQRTRNSASSQSAKRAKALVASDAWTAVHPMFEDDSSGLETARQAMLARVGGFRPQESIFEIGARRGGRRNNEEAVDAIRQIRSGLEAKKHKSRASKAIEMKNTDDVVNLQEDDAEQSDIEAMSMASDSDLEVTFSGNHPASNGTKLGNNGAPTSFSHSEYFMSYIPTDIDMAEEQAYGVHSGSNTNFVEAARGATMDLAGDEGSKGFGEARGVMRWDKRHKKYVARENDDDGSKGKKLVRGESGAKIAASFKSRRYDAWKKANRITKAPRVGEAEAKGTNSGSNGKRYRHRGMKAPKEADKFRADYDTRKKKVANAKERQVADQGRRELHSVDDIRKQRRLTEKRKEKNARPSKRGRR